MMIGLAVVQNLMFVDGVLRLDQGNWLVGMLVRPSSKVITCFHFVTSGILDLASVFYYKLFLSVTATIVGSILENR
jgi:hypothetical protein